MGDPPAGDSQVEDPVVNRLTLAALIYGSLAVDAAGPRSHF